jgi:uncharacterized membrane protein YcjF (UPF0283 family)
MAAFSKYDWNALALLVPAMLIVGIGVVIIIMAALSDHGLRSREARMFDAWHKPIVRRSLVPAAQKWAQTMAVIEALESDDDRATPTWIMTAPDRSGVRSKVSPFDEITARYTSTDLARLLRRCA